MSKIFFGVSAVVIMLGMPTAAYAAVVINEVAWMGTSASANAEWIELRNTESVEVPLSGWVLMSSSGTPSISLAGTIAANGFYLLERTSDASVPDVVADQIYSGALANGGLTLTVKDATGVVVDTVEGGTDWKNIGGDNVSKQTAQRTSTGWVTAVGTPRADTTVSGGGSGTGTTTQDGSTPTSTINGTPVVTSTAFANPIPRLRILTGPGHVVAQGARTPYDVHVYDEYGTVLMNPNVTWNFGDGDVAYGRHVEHTYRLPGTYTAVIFATAGPSQSTATLTIRVDSVAAYVVRVDEHGVTVRNDQDTLLDLSGWKLASPETTFVLPPFSVIAPQGEVTYVPEITGVPATTTVVSLLLPEGAEVSRATTTPVGVEPENAVNEVAVQPVGRVLGIQTLEEAAPQIVITESTSYADATTAPDAPVKPAASGALHTGLAPIVTSPWTASFLGLLLAAGAALVIL